MKKLFQFAAVLCATLITQYGFADGDQYIGGDGCCAPPDQACESWTLMCHYEPCYYDDWKCIEVPQYYKKKCCRWVNKNYDVQRCRYVPQYYTETCCRQEPEYYCTDECRTVKKWVCDKKCKYVPRYYYKKTGGDCAPSQPVGCAPVGCAPSCR